MSTAKSLSALLRQSLADRRSQGFFVDENMDSIPTERIPEEYRKMSAFLPILVLVPKSSLPRETAESRTPLGVDTVRNAAANSSKSHSASPLQVVKSWSANPAPHETLKLGEVLVNFSTMEVHCRGRSVELTTKGFKMLAYLAANPKRVISRDELLTQVWGYDCYPCTRTVDNHILQLRKKLEPSPASPRHFLTVHGSGYKFIP